MFHCMKKIVVIFLSYIILFFNSNLLSDENNKKLKIGLLAPLTGEYADLGKSLLYSLQLALNEIDIPTISALIGSISVVSKSIEISISSFKEDY